MGFFNKILGKSKTSNFRPDFNVSEFDNWMKFLELGGTSQEWKALISKNNWTFKENEAEIFARYRDEVYHSSSRYFDLLNKIQNNWSVLYNSQNYTGDLAKTLEKQCLDSVLYYEEMKKINEKYGESTPTNIPALKRLAMLYEKQEKFEEAVETCKKAYSYGMDERGRMVRMIKKAGRTPTPEEEAIINSGT